MQDLTNLKLQLETQGRISVTTDSLTITYRPSCATPETLTVYKGDASTLYKISGSSQILYQKTNKGYSAVSAYRTSQVTQESLYSQSVYSGYVCSYLKIGETTYVDSSITSPSGFDTRVTVVPTAQTNSVYALTC